MNPPTTIRDLAKAAGVSIATISMALRNHPRVSAKTRTTIRALAAEMGYIPNPRVAELMGYLRKGQTGQFRETLAFVSKMPMSEFKIYGTFHDQYLGAIHRAAELGYACEFHTIGRSLKEAHLARILVNRGIRGVLVLPQIDPEEQSKGFESFPWEKFASVSIGFSCLIPDTHRVMHDQIHALHIAMAALRKRGYQRPAFIIKRWVDNRLRNHWTAGFLSCQLRSYAKKNHVPPFLNPADEAGLVSWFRRWKPDALIGPDLAGPIGVLEKAGFRCPRDFGYATLDKQMEGQWAFHSGIAQMSTYVGETAVNLLVGCLLRNEIGLPTHPQVVLLPGTWADGETTPRRTSA
ncbi:MAG: hypothetical protein B9S32_17265 [Verrucomicrobia bacterium Tous-C9LFEB]|nr:MAG: hypothetical protein B9S32_17265 [Verrucomicrobia bacterium Tous-C9LFEB]